MTAIKLIDKPSAPAIPLYNEISLLKITKQIATSAKRKLDEVKNDILSKSEKSLISGVSDMPNKNSRKRRMVKIAAKEIITFITVLLTLKLLFTIKSNVESKIKTRQYWGPWEITLSPYLLKTYNLLSSQEGRVMRRSIL